MYVETAGSDDVTDDHPPELDYTHTRLLVTDFPACLTFYRDVLGFDVVWGDEAEGYADFRTGETTLALFEKGAMADAVGTEAVPANPTGQDEVALVFSVQSVDDAYERLGSEATFVTEPHDQPEWGIRVAHLRDPDGTLIEMNEPLEGES